LAWVELVWVEVATGVSDPGPSLQMCGPSPEREQGSAGNPLQDRSLGELGLLGLTCGGLLVGWVGVVLVSEWVAGAGVLMGAAGLAGFWLSQPKDP
jgi:hypothetical protein